MIMFVSIQNIYLFWISIFSIILINDRQLKYKENKVCINFKPDICPI